MLATRVSMNWAGAVQRNRTAPSGFAEAALHYCMAAAFLPTTQSSPISPSATLPLTPPKPLMHTPPHPPGLSTLISPPFSPCHPPLCRRMSPPGWGEGQGAGMEGEEAGRDRDGRMTGRGGDTCAAKQSCREPTTSTILTRGSHRRAKAASEEVTDCSAARAAGDESGRQACHGGGHNHPAKQESS